MPAPKAPNRQKFLVGVLIGCTLGLTYPGFLYLRSTGFDAYDGKDYPRAARFLLPVAAAGDAVAQSVVGSMYAIGSGVDQDGAKAVYWLERAANSDVTQAQMMLGTLYFTGIVVPSDLDKARFWLEKAAAANDAEAAQMLNAIRIKKNQM